MDPWYHEVLPEFFRIVPQSSVPLVLAVIRFLLDSFPYRGNDPRTKVYESYEPVIIFITVRIHVILGLSNKTLPHHQVILNSNSTFHQNYSHRLRKLNSYRLINCNVGRFIFFFNFSSPRRGNRTDMKIERRQWRVNSALKNVSSFNPASRVLGRL